MTTAFQHYHRPRAARARDKRTPASREKRSFIVAGLAPRSLLWQANPGLRRAGEALIQAGVDLGQALRSKPTAQGIAWLCGEWDMRFNLYAAHAEMAARRPEDLTGLGLALRTVAPHPLVPPLAVTARYDVRRRQMQIHVRRPPGERGCLIEISPTPFVSGTFQALGGNGARRVLSGYAPGTYAVRAAMVGRDRHSPYSQTVIVIVP
jgi:hypothetical protein